MNAERIPFQGMVEDNLLLHFWTLVSLTYIPQVVSPDGKMDYPGFVLAIPEPAELEMFLDDVRSFFGSLDTDTVGSRPRSCFIAVPEEGGLKYLHDLVHNRMKGEVLGYSLAAIEIYHLHKQGNNIRSLAVERVIPDHHILSSYEPIQKTCRNPLFKAQRVRNLLADKLWHAGMDALFASYPSEFFVQKHGVTPVGPPSFALDVKRRFSSLQKDMSLMGGEYAMTKHNLDDGLSRRLYRLIGCYVSRRTEEKSGQKMESFQANRDEKGRIQYPKEYREARERVCGDAFLAMRGRSAHDFVEYFTGTICSVPQFLPEQDYLDVSRALVTDWQTVKTLSMLALSAHSYLGQAKSDSGGEQ